MDTNPEISIIAPVWNEEEENLREFFYRVKKVLLDLRYSSEVIFVDSNSNEDNLNFLKSFCRDQIQIKIIRFSRNYGQTAAFLAGFEYAMGDIIVAIDVDLQCQPEDIPKLLEKIEEGYPLVCGWRAERKDPFLLRRLPSYLINKYLNFRLNKDLHDWGCTFIAIKRPLIKQLLTYGRNARFIKPILSHISSSLIEIKVAHYPRRFGKSKYNMFRLLKTAFDAIFRLSLEPEITKKSIFEVKEIIEKNYEN